MTNPLFQLLRILLLGEKFDISEFASSLNSRQNNFCTLADRPKGIAWIVSHCNSDSDRERYVCELRNYIDVDIFGTCGSHLWPTKKLSALYTKKYNADSCMENVEQNYMFYLAFENSFCD